MRTVYIMIEGPTEEEFVNNSLSHYLKNFGIVNTVPIRLETSLGFYGGDINFNRYQKNANNLLISDPTAIVTSLIDYYELRADFPGYAEATLLKDKTESVSTLEKEIDNIFNNERLIPYIQLHEFEALLFSDIKGFQIYFPHLVPKVQYIINNYPNPELINDKPETCPSARLKALIGNRKYKKTLHGPLLALENGINPILEKCPRFKKWIDTIILKATT